MLAERGGICKSPHSRGVRGLLTADCRLATLAVLRVQGGLTWNGGTMDGWNDAGASISASHSYSQ